MDSAQYEELVSRVAQKVRDGMPRLQSSAIGFGQTNRIQGASGYHHQIDVSVEAASVLLLVECKCWQTGVDTVNTLAFCARCIDITARLDNQKKVVAALAAMKGYDPGAVQLANFFGVKLWKVMNEQEFVCRVMEVVSVGLVNHAGVFDRVLVKVVRAGDSP
jgi:hypothetical protein